MSVTVRDIVAAIDARTPFAWAETWDNVGLLAGDAARHVTGVLVSLDQTREAVERAVSLEANVLVTHHPAFVDPPGRIEAGGGGAGVLFAALDAGVALVAAHTNLDRDPVAGDALSAAVGLTPFGPLESELQPASHVTVFCPPDAADSVAEALAAAGAGRVGLYSECSFASPGEGSFRPLEGSAPTLGRPGHLERAAEVRLETVCAPGAVAAVCASARDAHPYEEPLIVVSAASVSRGAARMGRLCAAPEGSTVDSVARLVATGLGVSPRVWGEGGREVGVVACATGSGGSMVPHALTSGASALVCGELRYHDALDAVSRGLAVIEAGHDATEWPLVPALAEIVRTTPGLAAGSVHVDAPVIGWRVVNPEA